MNNKSKPYWFYVVSAIWACFLWSTSYSIIKNTLLYFSPFMMAFLRFILATFCFAIIVTVKREWAMLPKKDMIWAVVSGFLGTSLYFALENVGISLTTASSAALIVGAYPIVSIIYEFIFLKKKLPPYKLVGIMFAVFGVFLLMSGTPKGLESAPHPVLGDMLLLIGGLVWIIYNFTAARLVNKYPITLVSFYQCFFGTILFLPFMLMDKNPVIQWNINGILGIIYLTLTCSVLAFILYNISLQRLSNTTLITILNLIPVFGVIISLVFLKEPFGIREILGGIIIITGVSVSIYEKKVIVGNTV